MLVLLYSSFPLILLFFFFNDTATTEIYTLSLHDALPICAPDGLSSRAEGPGRPPRRRVQRAGPATVNPRSEEHTSELQSQSNLVCRLLLEKKKNSQPQPISYRSRHLCTTRSTAVGLSRLT